MLSKRRWASARRAFAGPTLRILSIQNPKSKIVSSISNRFHIRGSRQAVIFANFFPKSGGIAGCHSTPVTLVFGHKRAIWSSCVPCPSALRGHANQLDVRKTCPRRAVGHGTQERVNGVGCRWRGPAIGANWNARRPTIAHGDLATRLGSPKSPPPQSIRRGRPYAAKRGPTASPTKSASNRRSPPRGRPRKQKTKLR